MLSQTTKPPDTPGRFNPGDVKPVGEGVSALRIPYGPGYRVYYTAEGDLLILQLTGGSKVTQQDDINEAKRLARAWRRETR
ncbi:MAG: type II toxin-antitoxin system RelE/ParE family toxin [Propionibacteriaceae bacterium]|nr:hypothetical protein [Micropruina sp.]